MARKIILIFGLFIILILFLTGCTAECFTDNDCVPAQCCHASECLAKENAPDCSEIYCSMECAEGTMDCGQGKCACRNGKCVAEFL